MIALAAYLFALLAVFLAAYFVIAVLLVALERAPDTEKENFVGVFWLFLFQVWTGSVAVGWALVWATVALGEHLARFWYLYLFAAALAIPAEINARYNDEIWQGNDAMFARFWVPLYRNVLLVFVEILETLWRVFICIYNTLGSIGRIFTINFFDIAFKCEAMDWGNVADRLSIAIEEPVLSLVSWILSFGADDFDLTTPLEAIANVTVAFEPLLLCECQTLHFAYEIAFRTVTLHSLHAMLDRALNAYISYLRELIMFVVALFDAIFGLPQPSLVEELALPIVIGTDPNRAPRWNDTRNHVCLVFVHAGDLLDDLVGILLDVFVGISPDDVPKLGPFFANLFCLAPDLAQIVADVVFHLDVFVAGNFWEAIQDDLDPLFAHAYNASSGILKFWEPFGHPITDDLGCVFSAVSNVTIAAGEVTARILVDLPLETSFAGIKAFIESDRVAIPAAFVEESSLLAFDCTASLMTNINAPLGSAFNETVHAFTSLLRAVVGVLMHVDEVFDYLIGARFKADIERIFFELDAAAVAYGNFVRQFSLEPSRCRLRDPHVDMFAPIPDEVDIFCCAGGTVESVLRLVFGAFEFVAVGIVRAAASVDFKDAVYHIFIATDAPGNLFNELIPMLEALIDSLTCFWPSLLVYVDRIIDYLNAQNPNLDIPSLDELFDCGADGELPELIRDVYSGLLKWLLVGPLGVIDGLIKVIYSVIPGSGHSHSSDFCSTPLACSCQLMQALYKAGLGGFANWLRQVGKLVSCVTGIDVIKTITRTFHEFFGAPGGPNGIYQKMCDIVDFIADAIEFIVLLFTDFGAFLRKIFEALAETPVIKGIKKTIAKISNFIVSLVDSIRGVFDCIGGFLGDLFDNFSGCVLSCYISNCDECPSWSDCATIPSPHFKRAGGDGDDDDDDDGTPITIKFLWDATVPGTPCHKQIMAARAAQDGDVGLRDLFEIDAKRCYFSATIARVIDVALLQVDVADVKLVDPYFLYDPMVGFQLLVNLTTRLPYVGTYLFDFITNETRAADFNVTILDHLKARNVSDPLIERVGILGEIFVRIFKAYDEEGIDSTGASFMKGVLTTWRYGYEAWKEMWNAIPEESAKRVVDRERSDALDRIKRRVANPTTWLLAANLVREDVANRTRPFFLGGATVFREIVDGWLDRTGYAPRTEIFDGVGAIATAIKARLEWRNAGSVPSEEPKPRGTSLERRRWARMLEREKDAPGDEQASYWRKKREALYPQLAYLERAQVATSNCGERACWDASGTVIGTCKTDGLFCGCALNYTDSGACCTDAGCSIRSELLCLSGNGNWTASATCEACSAIANATQGACCGGVSGAKTCRILAKTECAELGGFWNPGLTCADRKLAKECEHCSLHLLPDFDFGREILCPLAGEVSFLPCDERNAWDPVGRDTGSCILGSDPILGNPRCDVRYDSNKGACCDGTCQQEKPDDCLDDPYIRGAACDVCNAFVDLARGACCYEESGSKRCALSSSGVCEALTGTWNPGKFCSSPNLDVDCEHCRARSCKRCDLLVASLNDAADILIACVNDLLWARELPATSKSFRMPYDPPPEFKPAVRRAIVGDGVASLGRLVLRVLEALANAAIRVASWLFRFPAEARVDIEKLTDDLAEFFTNPDPDDPGGFLFYVSFVLVCEPLEHTRCELGRQGLGLVPALLWVYGSLLVLLLLVGLLFPALLVPLGLLSLFSPFAVMSAAYFMSPACFLPTFIPTPIGIYPWPFPLLPNCLGTDVLNASREIDVPCLPLCEVTGDQSLPPDLDCDQTLCPGPEEDYRREFPDCWAEPYSFRGPLRSLAFFLRWRLPGLNCFLFETNFVPLAFVDDLPLIGERLDFPGDECSEPDFVDARWRWCFRNNFLFWFPLFAFLLFWIIVFLFFLPAIQVFVAAWISGVALFILLLLAMFSRFTRSGDLRNRYWRHRWETDLGPPPPRSGKSLAAGRAKGGRKTLEDSLNTLLRKAPSQVLSRGAPPGFRWRGAVAPTHRSEYKKE